MLLKKASMLPAIYTQACSRPNVVDTFCYTTCRYRSVIEHKVATLRALTCSDVALSAGGVAVISGDADVTSDGAPMCRGKNLASLPNSTRSVPVT